MRKLKIYEFALALITTLSLVLPANANPSYLVDEKQPIALYCDSTLYACEGYSAISDEQYLPPWAPAFKNVQGYYHNDLAGIYRFPSYAVAVTRDSSGNGTKVIACTDISSTECAGTDIYFRADLPMCSSQVIVDCMRDFLVTNDKGKSLEFENLGEFPVGNPQYFKGNLALKVPNGGGPTLIRIPEAPHNGGDLYLLKSQMTGSKLQANQPFHMDGLAVSITAVKLIDGKYVYSGASTNPSLYTKGFAAIGVETGTYPSTCAIASPTQCAAKYSLPMGLKFSLTVELSRKITGWLHGRIKSPEVNVATNKYGGSTLTVKAEPIKIPVNATWVMNETAAPSIKDFYRGKSNSGSPLFGNENKSKPLSEIALMRDSNTGHNIETLNEYLAWLSTLGDKAQALPTAWTIQTMGNLQISDQIQKCLNESSSLAGIVTTNAAEYLDGPPTFNKSEGTLDYKVAATHFEPDGKTVFRGTYDLIMSSTVARCIYGFSNAPISATVSITSDSAESSVATTQVSEKSGWFTLNAYNFTYSSPTIRVKLSGTPIALLKPVAVKKITCTKGKSIKVFTGTKCPAGFKKK
ncbi:MAG: hypothetical protein ACKN9O_00660 [Actinomycetota bacterium]